MKVGDIIMVFEDPITKQTPEGKAEILDMQEHDTELGTPCLVRFIEDGYEVYRRVI